MDAVEPRHLTLTTSCSWDNHLCYILRVMCPLIGIPSIDQVSLNPNLLSTDGLTESAPITPRHDKTTRLLAPVTSSPKISPQPSPELSTKSSKDSKAGSSKQQKYDYILVIYFN